MTTKTKPKYQIDTDLGIDYADCGPWRSYHLTTDGNTKAELIENATIAEVDQDGGELNDYGLKQCDREVEAAVHREINRALNPKDAA